MVKPQTVVSWHPKGFELFWTWKSRKRRPGRPRIDKDIRKLIVAMAGANVGWGALRIRGEPLKLGILISERTVQRYMRKLGAPPGSRHQRRTFLHNHMHESLAIEFAVVPTITVYNIYVFFVLQVDRRRVLHFNVTRHPTAQWTPQQVVEACPFDLRGRFLFLDNDKICGAYFKSRVDGLGLQQVTTAYRSPWQNPHAERWGGGLRGDCLDRVIALHEDQLRRIVRSYVNYSHEDRTHLGLEKDTPISRAVEPTPRAKWSRSRVSAGFITATHGRGDWPRSGPDAVSAKHRFIHGYENAGGTLTGAVRQAIVPVMRTRPLCEALFEIAESARGHDVDGRYLWANLTCADHLRAAGFL